MIIDYNWTCNDVCWHVAFDIWHNTNVAFQEKLVKLKTQALPKPEIIPDGEEVKEVGQKLCSSDHLKGIPLKSEITFCVKQECTEKAVVFSVTTNLADPVITILRIQKINKSNKSWKLSNMKICMSKYQQTKDKWLSKYSSKFPPQPPPPPRVQKCKKHSRFAKISVMSCDHYCYHIIFFLLGCYHNHHV